MRKFVIAGALLLSLNPLAADTLTVEQALELILQGNRDIRIASIREEQAALNNSAGNAGMLPTVSATGSVNTAINNTTQSFYTGEERVNANARNTQMAGGIGAGITLFDGLGMFAVKQELEELERLAGLEQRLIAETILAEGVMIYYQVALANRQVLLQNEMLELSDDRVDLAYERWQAGAGSELDYLQALADYRSDSMLVADADYASRVFKGQLNVLAGRAPETPFAVSMSMDGLPELQYAALREAMVNRNPAVLLAQGRQVLAEVQLKQSRSERFPEILAQAGYSYSKSTSEAGLLQSSVAIGPTAGLTFRFDLFNGGNINRQIKVAKLEQEIAGLDMQQTILELEQELYAAFQLFELAAMRATVQQRNLEVTRRNVETGRDALREGVISNIEFRELQNQLVTAGFGYYSALYDARRNQVTLSRLTGLNP